MSNNLCIREIRREEFEVLDQLMVEVYSKLEGFPGRAKQPGYYDLLANIGRFTEKKDAKVLVATSAGGELVGGVVYFGDMTEYGSGGIATTMQNASGIRLLVVRPSARGMGTGKALTNVCIRMAKDRGHSQVILHTTQAMQTAWRLYEGLGFKRAGDLDFIQGELPVMGFKLHL